MGQLDDGFTPIPISGDVYVLYYDSNNHSLMFLHNIYEQVKNRLGEKPLICLPNDMDLEGMEKTKCIEMMKNMIEYLNNH